MEPKFELGQEVVVIGNQKKGTVIAKWEELGGGLRYSVRYFDDDNRADSEWFFARELQESSE